MTQQFVEAIGRDVPNGLRTSPDSRMRFSVPGPGDPIAVGHLTGYPYEGKECTPGGREYKHKYARISGFYEDENGRERFTACMSCMGVFLNASGSVSISGGPFISGYTDELDPTFTVKHVSFWNWGDRFPGAGQGVDYMLARPVFKFVPEQQS